MDYYQNNAEWIGKQSSEEAEKNGAALINFRNIGFDNSVLPDDYTLYVLINSVDMERVRIYKSARTGHGIFSAGFVGGAAIDGVSNTIIFFGDGCYVSM